MKTYKNLSWSLLATCMLGTAGMAQSVETAFRVEGFPKTFSTADLEKGIEALDQGNSTYFLKFHEAAHKAIDISDRSNETWKYRCSYIVPDTGETIVYTNYRTGAPHAPYEVKRTTYHAREGIITAKTYRIEGFHIFFSETDLENGIPAQYSDGATYFLCFAKKDKEKIEVYQMSGSEKSRLFNVYQVPATTTLMTYSDYRPYEPYDTFTVRRPFYDVSESSPKK